MITFKSTPAEDTICFGESKSSNYFSDNNFWFDQDSSFACTPVGASGNRINSPAHYNKNEDIECIEAIKAALGTEKFRGFCQGNAIKYLWRADHKNDTVEDLKKCRWYLDRLIASHESI